MLGVASITGGALALASIITDLNESLFPVS
jgi:hypothetical protein